jgi:hypothetical protein
VEKHEEMCECYVTKYGNSQEARKNRIRGKNEIKKKDKQNLKFKS